MLGVIDAETNLLIETIPLERLEFGGRRRQTQPDLCPAGGACGSGRCRRRHDDCRAGICATDNGCVAVYVHNVDADDPGAADNR